MVAMSVRETINVLGDIRAEADKAMLDRAFFESADYRTLLESAKTPVVVGRRGTGKSAAVYRLEKHFSQLEKTKVLAIRPDEDQIIGIRPLLALFGDKFNHIKRGALLSWKYAIYMAALDALAPHYKLKKLDEFSFLDQHLNRWNRLPGSFSMRYRQLLRNCLERHESPEERVASMAHELELNHIEESLDNVLTATKTQLLVLLDRMDEGYEPDNVGIAFVDGVTQAMIDVNDHRENMRAFVFLRDNIFRAVAAHDPDYSRNIEGQVLRLHWDEHQLFTLVSARVRIAFGLQEEKSIKVWNSVTAKNLVGREGFRKCLQFTLYRPRDIVSLLNKAFYNARRQGRDTLVDEDIESTAKEISSGRLDDLTKEYTAIFPSLPTIVARFAGQSPEMTFDGAIELLKGIRDQAAASAIVQQDLEILRDPSDIVRNLYSVGFLGILDPSHGNYVFCHDGAAPTKDFHGSTKLLVHPCYWIALNLTRDVLDPREAEVIYDEYDIQVASVTPEQRAKRLGKLIAEFEEISPGRDHASQFEHWCLEAVKVVFAGALTNIELHPNKNAKQRRDIVATNLGRSLAWKRIMEDYKSRQVIFEVKNFTEIGASEYRQLLSYSGDMYGKLAFVITRDEDENLRKGGDLDWTKEMYGKHGVLIVKITGKWLSKLLSKLRSPQKHDVVDKTLNGLLDRYLRQYL